MERHRIGMGYYKCHMSPDCAVMLFSNAANLRLHQHAKHGVMPPPQSQQQCAGCLMRIQYILAMKELWKSITVNCIEYNIH
ncbi:hypothetical protein J6590_028484 [Homalodisca vitripennis]|nr:hypothetical protein J6590_028484 [Homalodisca vitripennis]